MRVRFAIGCALALAVQTGQAADLKGLAPGMDFEAAREALGKRPSCRTPPLQFRPFTLSCMQATTFGGVDANVHVMGFDDTVKAITFTFPAIAYPTILAGLQEKFGSPHDASERTLTNRMGAAFQSARAVWMLDQGRLTADERSSRVDRGSVAWTAHDLPESRPDGEAAASDM